MNHKKTTEEMKIKISDIKIVMAICAMIISINVHSQTLKFGALAIDKSNGFYYGWSNDYSSRAEAEQKAVAECKSKGGNCHIVLTYSGNGCAVYRTIDGNVSTAYGWGVAKTRAEADAIATSECLKRSNGIPANNHVWSCNSDNANSLKVLFDASKEMSSTTGNSFTDMRDGKVYNTVAIGNQVWFAENLAYAPSTGKYWAYDNNQSNVAKYGYLYNWQTAGTVCPTGWHLPSEVEWKQLFDHMGGASVAGNKLREAGAVNWRSNPGATNESGFTALPGGAINSMTNGFFNINGLGHWWTSTSASSSEAIRCYLNGGYPAAYLSNMEKQFGLSVRCVKD